MIIYFEDKYQDVDQVFLDALVPGVVDCKGVFETMRVYERKIFAFEDHMQRLQKGLRVYGYKKPLDVKKIKKNIRRLLDENSLRLARVRISFSLEQSWKMNIVCAPVKSWSAEDYQRGYHLKVATSLKERTILSHIKTLQYKNFLKEYQAAVCNGFDEALFLDNNNCVIEGTRTNIFGFQKGCLCTAPVMSGCVNGITRKYVVKVARSLGLKVKIEPILLKVFMKSDEAFVTNSVVGIMPIHSVAGKVIGRGKRAQTKELQAAFEIYVQKFSKLIS